MEVIMKGSGRMTACRAMANSTTPTTALPTKDIGRRMSLTAQEKSTMSSPTSAQIVSITATLEK